MDAKEFIKEEPKLFALFIGRSGSGKTVAAASMPKPMQEIDTDLRANGLINVIRQGWLDPEGIDIKQFDPFKGYIELQNHLNMLHTFVGMRQFQFKSIDVGSATSLIRLLNLTSLNIPSGGTGIGHINLAGLAVTGGGDYKFESQAMHKIMDYLRALPCNVTVAAHIIDRWGKKAGAKELDPQQIIGEKLTLGTANVAENVLSIFNDVYKFTKEIVNGIDKYFVEFNTEIAKNTFGIPPGKFDITKVNFWNFFQETIKNIKDGTFKAPTNTNTGFLTL